MIQVSNPPSEDPDIFINVLDITKGRHIARISCLRSTEESNLGLTLQELKHLMNEMSFVYYDESHHEIITGHEDGSLVIWH